MLRCKESKAAVVQLSVGNTAIFYKFADQDKLWTVYHAPPHPEPLETEHLHAYVYVRVRRGGN